MIPLRSARELTYQLHQAGESDRLANALATIPIFMTLFEGEMRDDVLRYWAELGEGYDLESAYRRGLERWRDTATDDPCPVLGRVAEMLRSIGRWEGAVGLQRECLALAIENGDRSTEAHSRLALGWLLSARREDSESYRELTVARELFEQLGDRHGMSNAIGRMGAVFLNRAEYDRALECYREEEVIDRELGDRHGRSLAIGNMGTVHWYRGEHDRALEHYRERESTCRELGDRHGMSNAIGNIGMVHFNLGDFDRAMECYRQKEEMSRELGNLRELSVAIGNIGVVYQHRGEYEGALDCYGQQEAISRELGNRADLAMAIGNIGSVYQHRGEFDRALERFVESEVISREIGDRRGLAVAIGNKGFAHYQRGEFHLALECLMWAADEHRAIGFRPALTGWLSGAARVLLELAAFGGEMAPFLPTYVSGATSETWRAMSRQRAREHAEECVAISGAISMSDTLFDGHVILARIEAAEGRKNDAWQRLSDMLLSATDDDQRAELHYWMWRISPESGVVSRESKVEGASVDRTEAQRLYELLAEKNPKHEYHKRIDELRADEAAE